MSSSQPMAQGGRQPQASYAPSADADAQFDTFDTQFDIGTCPECGTGHMAFEEGCKKCHVCGYSECG